MTKNTEAARTTKQRTSTGKRRTLRIAVAVVTVIAIAVGVLAFFNRPLSRDQVHEAIDERLTRVVAENDSVSSVLLTVAEASGDVHEFAVGTTHPGSSEPVGVDSPYHSASVGKTMLATVYGQLVDEGVLAFDDPVTRWLDADTLAGLFVVDGVDRAGQVTIGQLLRHTSGVGDYFEGPVDAGPTMLATIATDPDRLFTPLEIVAFTRDRQVPVGQPGETFSYSDTGYILLGLALESIEDKPYDEILEDRIFRPLGMADSHLMTRFGVESDILAIEVNGVDLSTRNALSLDWAGGGVVTTMADLLTFMRALEGGELVSPPVHREMTDFSNDVDTGIGYGMGMMQFRFSELSPLLFSMSDVHGAVGVTGTFALYDPASETHYIANFGSFEFRERAIEELIDIRLTFDRLEG
ncbi:serine hydrolase domain-containing protein [Oerskovia flava]|uniref:serine hydrolase domain-containing protein n=1 Tax=Oerskovia flava TaxID=2986422 RepID=UPI00223FE94E|nr:serine hydrolase domain-containing protein [Oerskovia sp. JB1-3-2]